MSDQRSKNHHYVPQFYLRNFANRKGKLWDTWRGPDGRLHEKERSPKSIGSTRELYSTVPFPTKWSDEREDSVEAKFFSDIDNNASGVLTEVLRNPGSLNPEQSRTWARFIQSLLERNPLALEVRRDQLDSLTEPILGEMLGRCESEEGRERLQDVFDGLKLDELIKYVNLHLMTKEIDDEQAVDSLSAFKMTLLSGSFGFELITGDQPVVVNRGVQGQIDFYTLALSPNDLLFACRPDAEDVDSDSAKNILLVHSLLILRQARHVFSTLPLQDGVPIKFRTAAESLLPELPWE